MLTTLRLCYFKGIRTRENMVGLINSAVCQFAQSVQSVKNSWQDCSIFDRSPLDEIAAQRLFEIERNFFKINGYNYAPLRPPRPPSGHMRVEFYSDTDRSQLCRARSDCWADVPLLSTGQLDLKYVKTAFSMDPNHFAIIDPIRMKPLPFEGQRRLSPLAIHNLTFQGRLPLRVTELNVPPVTQSKRLARHYFLTLIGMLSALYQLVWYMCAYNEYEFPYPLPSLFLSIYNILRAIYPATHREEEAPDLDVLNSPTGESFEVGLPDVDWYETESEPEVLYGKSQFARLFSGPTQSQLWCVTILGYAVFMWLIAAEVVACARM